MIDLFKVDDSLLYTGMRLLRDAMKAKGWRVEVPYPGSSHCFIDRQDGREALHIFSTSPPSTSFSAGHLANDKYATYQRIKEARISQPKTILVNNTDNIDEAVQLMSEYSSVIVKPLDAGHGDGITTSISNVQELATAIALASKESKNSGNVIVQQMLTGEQHDIRIACIDYKFVGAIWRVPASVVGDGEKNLGELIECENQTKRGKAYHAKYAFINTERARQYLGDQIKYVPKLGEKVRVMGVANYGQGGEIIDITDSIPDWLRKESEKIAKICNLPVCGVDFLSNKEIKHTDSRADVEVFFIENNKCPSLAIHDRPTTGKGRGAIKKYVDYLDTL